MRVYDKVMFSKYQPDHVSYPKVKEEKKLLVNKFEQICLNFSSLFENSCEYSTITFNKVQLNCR